MALNPDRIYVREPLRSSADARLGRLWSAQDLRSYRLGRPRYERLQKVVDDAFWRALRYEQDQRGEETALALAEPVWLRALNRELRVLPRPGAPQRETGPGPRDVTPRDMPEAPAERPPVSNDLPGVNLQPLDPADMPSGAVIDSVFRRFNEPLDDAAIQAWADFYSAFPPGV
jgi:hypothetical protein